MNKPNDKYIQTVQFLMTLYLFLNERIFESALSIEPVITLQFDETDSTLGWFRAKEVWRENLEDKGNTQINLSAQYLNKPIEDIADTMIHEMCHLYAYQYGIKDTSRNCYYHNKKFKVIAESHGLIVNKSKDGWSRTSLRADTLEIIRAEYPKEVQLIFHKTQRELLMEHLANIGNELSANSQPANEIKKSSTRKYICPICGNSVRATKDLYVICGDCNARMEKVK